MTNICSCTRCVLPGPPMHTRPMVRSRSPRPLPVLLSTNINVASLTKRESPSAQLYEYCPTIFNVQRDDVN